MPNIMNFVLYNGTEEHYPYHESILQYFDNPALAELLLNRSFTMINLNEYTDETLIRRGPSGIMEILLKRANRDDFPTWLKQNGDWLRSILENGKYVQQCLAYILAISNKNLR